MTPMYTLIRDLPSPADTEALGHELSLVSRPGAAILLEGELGTGKTTLARALIQALSAAGEPIEVPSPTFTLIQSYEATRMPVAHADLYRIAEAREADELGLEDLIASHLVLVEWPDRLDRPFTDDRLHIRLEPAGRGRRVTLQGAGSWEHALKRLNGISQFLPGSDYAAAGREFLEGDASFRRYERLKLGDQSFVLMDMPARPDGPVVKHGKTYSAIAHLAEDIRAVLAVNSHLIASGYSAPIIHACDLDRGLAVIEDLGCHLYGRMMLAGEDMSEPMGEAVRLLAEIAQREWPSEVPVAAAGTHVIAPYDIEAQSIETELLMDWYWPFAKGAPAPQEVRDNFAEAWAGLLPLTQPDRRVWTLRDYHSPNLMWLPERQGLKRVGLIDTQDCVLGHPAYDLVSMLRDARVEVPFSVADDLFEYYCAERASAGGFDRAEFERAFAILSVQRATKILGIFARLSRRDGKHGYIRHMPRVWRYLDRDLGHPALTALKAWYDRYLPAGRRNPAG